MFMSFWSHWGFQVRFLLDGVAWPNSWHITFILSSCGLARQNLSPAHGSLEGSWEASSRRHRWSRQRCHETPFGQQSQKTMERSRKIQHFQGENQLFRLGHGFNSYFDITRGYHEIIIGYTICHHRLADLMKSLTPEVCHVVQSPYAVAWLSNIEISTDVVIEIFEGQAHMLVVKWKTFSISTVAGW